MPGSWGVTPAGFVLKPFSAILADKQAAFLANIDPGLDLSPTSPEGQMVTIDANADAELWELAQTAYNQSDPQEVEGQGADNIGDLRGIPRGGASFTQVFATLTWTDSGTVHAVGTLVANVLGAPTLTFANAVAVTSDGGTTAGILFQAQTVGSTPTINPNTLVEITAPVTGWSSITNPLAQSQLGANEETDAAYLARQDQELGVEGSNNASATAAALIALGEAQTPPIALTVNVLENRSDAPMTVGSLVLPPHSFGAIVYDPTATLTSAQIGQVIYNNAPPGIPTVGNTSAIVADPVLGNQTVFYTVPTPEPLFVDVTVVIRPNFVFAGVQAAIQTALEEASVAPTPPGGLPPLGQFGPGTPAVGSQLEGVVMGVPGVFDLQALTFDFTSFPTNTAPKLVSPTAIVTIAPGNVTVIPGTYP